jgi:hypothetical protein
MFRVLIAVSLVVAAFVAVLLWDGLEGEQTAAFELPSVQATALYDAACGCCGLHIEYMEKAGLLVERETTDDLSSVKDELGIPADLRSCHTTMIEGYIVEGHMPSEAISKLLGERPDIQGIALPAMPSGTPGMNGKKNETWVIYALEHDGTTSVFMEI